MTTMLFSKLLFGSKSSAKCAPGMRIGSVGHSGVGVSKARKDGSTVGGKLSIAALVFDAIRDGKISALEGENCVFVQYRSSDGTTYECLADAGSPFRVRYAGAKPEHARHLLAPLFVLEARKATANPAFRDTLLNLAKEVETEEVLRMCDALYFGSAKNVSVEIEENEISVASVHAALRAGLLNENHDILALLGAPNVEIDGVVLESGGAVPKSEDPAVSSSTDNFDDVLAGKCAVAYPWTDKQRERIPSLKTLHDFVPTAAFWKGSRKIKYRTDKVLERLDMGLTGLEALGKDAINFFMTGKPGTGKTTVAKALAAAYQLPFYSVPIQKGTEEGTFQGLLKARDGKFVFTSTDFLDAFKNGGVIVLEELNLADPAILAGAIGQAIESPYFVMEDEITPVYRHPLCIIIGTFNVGTAGSKEINPMLSSRFYQTYLVEDPDEGEFVARLQKYDCDKRTAKRIYTAYSRILDYLKSPDVSALEYCKNVTFRGCVGAIQCLQEGSPFREAIEDTLVNKIAEYDLELAKDVLKSVVETLPDH